MDTAFILILMFGGLVAMLMLSLPVAFAFIAVNVVGAFIVFGGEVGLTQMIRNSVSALTSYSLLPIPLFILMGEILFQSGVAQRAVGAVDNAIRRVPARLSVVSLTGGTIFAALSGSSVANTALLANTMLPEMLKRGYHPTLAMGPIMASGAIAILIPPSALAVLLGSLAKIPIGPLLLAGIVPALIMSFAFVVLVVGIALMRPDYAPIGAPPPKLSMAQRIIPLLRDVVPLSLVLITVVGTLLAGLATPTESSSFGCIAAVLICMLYRAISVETLIRAARQTLALSTMILFIVAASITFSQILSFSGATQQVVGTLSVFADRPAIIMLLVIAALLVLGCFLDQISMMMLTLPVVMPLAQVAGLDLIVLGTVFLLTMEIGLLTPPFGLLLFVMKGAAPSMHTSQIYAAIVPFLTVKLSVLALIVLVPALVHWLPNLMIR